VTVNQPQSAPINFQGINIPGTVSQLSQAKALWSVHIQNYSEITDIWKFGDNLMGESVPHTVLRTGQDKPSKIRTSSYIFIFPIINTNHLFIDTRKGYQTLLFGIRSVSI
jgi:hypothetical protein